MNRLVTLCLLCLALVLPSSADQAGWKAVVDKIEGSRDYSFKYTYRGPEGTFFFDYAVVREGPKVRTEILEGSDRGKGTVILYDPEQSTDTVTMKASLFTLRRSLESKDIKDSSLYIPLYDQLLDKVGPAKMIESKSGSDGEHYLFKNGKVTHRVTVSRTKEIVHYSRSEGDKIVESFKFSNISWNRDPELTLE